MRTILAFVLATIVMSAQSPRQDNTQQIERIEKKLADGTATIQERAQLLNLYFASGKIEKYRDEMTWMIQNHPDSPQVRTNTSDPASDARFAELWRAAAAKPDAEPMTMVNAAWFFRFSDHRLAMSLIEWA